MQETQQIPQSPPLPKIMPLATTDIQPVPPTRLTKKRDHESVLPGQPLTSMILSPPPMPATDDEHASLLQETAPCIQESPIQSSLPEFTTPQLSASDTFLLQQAAVPNEVTINPNNGDSTSLLQFTLSDQDLSPHHKTPYPPKIGATTKISTPNVPTASLDTPAKIQEMTPSTTEREIIDSTTEATDTRYTRP